VGFIVRILPVGQHKLAPQAASLYRHKRTLDAGKGRKTPVHPLHAHAQY
jgi:hypothetical protein